MKRQPVTTIKNDGLRGSLGVSASLHVVALLILYFGLPSLMKPLPAPFVPVPFEIVEMADITNTRLQEQQETPTPPAPPPKPEPQKVVAPPPTPPAPPEPVKTQAQDQPKPDIAALMPAPVPAEKPKPPAAAKPQPDMLASVLKNVARLKPAEPVKNADDKSQVKDQAAQPKSAAPSLSQRLTISEEDSLRRQIEQCWNPPIGARDAQNLVVEVTINVNPDRTVQTAEVVDKSRMTGDPYFRAAAEAAIRAVYNPRCSPLELPDGKYDQWKTIDFTFDPRDML